MTALAEAIWASLPVPAFLLDADDTIADINPPAEQFLNASARAIRGQPVFDKLAIDAPLEEAFARVRADLSPLFINTVDVSGGNAPPVICNIQIAPLIGIPGHVLLVMEPRQIADRLGRAYSVTSAAKSAIGMAEMLAHEIKNPLAGITGAAQLLAMNLEPGDQELTDLIVAESRRIVTLLDQVEQFGNLAPPERRAVNIHDLLDRARKSATVGFAANMTIVEEFDPSLPPTYVDADQMLQVLLNLLKNASEAAGKAGGTIRLRTFYDMSLRLRRKDGSGAALRRVRALRVGPRERHRAGPGAGQQDHFRPRRLDFGGIRTRPHDVPNFPARGAKRRPRNDGGLDGRHRSCRR